MFHHQLKFKPSFFSKKKVGFQINSFQKKRLQHATGFLEDFFRDNRKVLHQKSSSKFQPHMICCSKHLVERKFSPKTRKWLRAGEESQQRYLSLLTKVVFLKRVWRRNFLLILIGCFLAYFKIKRCLAENLLTFKSANKSLFCWREDCTFLGYCGFLITTVWREDDCTIKKFGLMYIWKTSDWCYSHGKMVFKSTSKPSPRCFSQKSEFGTGIDATPSLQCFFFLNILMGVWTKSASTSFRRNETFQPQSFSVFAQQNIFGWKLCLLIKFLHQKWKSFYIRKVPQIFPPMICCSNQLIKVFTWRKSFCTLQSL